MWKYLLEKLIKWPNKGWFQEKQPLCLDNRKGKTESPHCFPNLSQKCLFSVFPLYFCKRCLFWDAAVPSTRAVSAYWDVKSSCSVDSKIKTEEFCNSIIKKTWPRGYRHSIEGDVFCVCKLNKSENLNLGIPPLDDLSEDDVFTWVWETAAGSEVTLRLPCAPKHHHHHTSARFPCHTQPRVYHRTPSFLGIP